MNTTELLAGLLKLACVNTSLRQSHISLYSAILVFYEQSSHQNLFRVSRRELMRYSSIRSFATYHKCLSELIKLGLIEYHPSYLPTLASKIRLLV